MEVIFKHSWIFLMFGTTLNGVIWWVRGKSNRTAHPERVSSYKRMIAWFLVIGNLPWLILGGGVLFGGFTSPLDPIILSDTNFWGWAFWIVLPVWSLGLLFYVFWREGDKELSLHPGLINLPEKYQTPTVWRIIAIVMFASQAVTFPFMWGNKGAMTSGYQRLYDGNTDNNP